jgi:putative addiction module killer protein
VHARPRNVEVYESADGRYPFEEYLQALKDPIGSAAIDARIGRLRLGSLGNYRDIGDGLIELKLNIGPGYRIYLADNGRNSLILCAGIKRTQKQNIKTAKDYWEDYQRRR